MEIKYDPIKGAIVDTENEINVTQPEFLLWSATHPEKVMIDQPKLTKTKAPGKMMVKGVESITIKERIK
jgi:hypothetical protein